MRDRAAHRRASAALLPPPPPVVVDVDQEQRQRFVLEQFAGGDIDVKKMVRLLVREFNITPDQARLDFQDVQDQVRAHLDSEGDIDVVMLGAVARLNMLEARFFEEAMKEVPDRVLDIPGRDGEEDIYRSLTSGEKASEMGARARAADVALKANAARIALIGKRSKRWAEKPQNVVMVTGNGALTPEQQETLLKLGMSLDTP
jgi:hypothetical protein